MTTNEEGEKQKFVDDTPIYFPPSFKDYEKGEMKWLRPEEYLLELRFDEEIQKRRQEKKEAFTRRKTLRKKSILAMGASPSLDEISQLSQA